MILVRTEGTLRVLSILYSFEVNRDEIYLDQTPQNFSFPFPPKIFPFPFPTLEMEMDLEMNLEINLEIDMEMVGNSIPFPMV